METEITYDMFRTDIVRDKNFKIMHEAEIISGFAVATKGVTHDKRGELDDTALDSIVDFGNKSKRGIKSRFGHPNMSGSALGTFLGRVKNFRRVEDIVRADLHIDETSHTTPDGDLGKYVMQLAESDPDAFGASMVIHWEEEFKKGKNGELLKNKDGEQIPPLIRIKNLLSIDVVDDPAANDGFFEFISQSVRPSAEMTTFLNKFLLQPDAVAKAVSFLERYQTNRSKSENFKEVKNMLSELTQEKLKAERPDLFGSISELGMSDGIKKGQEAERERVVSILKKSSTFSNMSTLAIEAVEQGFSVDQAVISFQEKQLEVLQKSSVPSIGPEPEEVKKTNTTHFEKATAYKKEHGCSMTEALQATAEKRK